MGLHDLLLARGRDRLETTLLKQLKKVLLLLSYSLGDAIDWKLKDLLVAAITGGLLLLARGRDRLET